MTDIDGKKLPSVDQVEVIISEWGKYSVEQFASRFNLEVIVIEATVESIRRLKRASDKRDTPAMSCFRNSTLDSIVRCAGARHGYV